MMLRVIFGVLMVLQSTFLFSQDRYWVHKPLYQNFFGSVAELAEWSLIEDNGTGGFTLSGTGAAVLKMDDASGNYANRIFSVNGSNNRYLPLDSIYGRLEVNILRTTGGNQRFFVQVQTFTAANDYINQINLLPPMTGSGFFSVNMAGFPWPPNANKIRFIIGGANFSGQQGTVEFDYLSYSNTRGVLSNSANWSETSGGAGGASVPGAGNTIIFDGANSSNGSCQLDVPFSIQGLLIRNTYSGNVDLQGQSMVIGTGGLSMSGGGFSANNSTLSVNGNVNISGGTFKSSSGLSTISGNVLVSGGSVDMSQGTIVLSGTADQNFSSNSPSPIHRLIVNKPGNLNLGSDLLVQDSLLLTAGIINTGLNSVKLGSSSVNPGYIPAGGSGMINGSIIKWISSTGNLTFPFGGTNFTAPLTLNITAAPSTPGTLKLSCNDFANLTVPVNFMDGPATILRRSVSGWSITPTLLNGGSYNLSVATNNLGYTGPVSDLHLVLANGVSGTHSPAGGPLSNPVLSRTGLTSTGLSNTFYVGMVSNILPVKWLDFAATTKQDKSVVLAWKLHENGVDYFEVQKTTNGPGFKTIAKIRSNGTGTHHYEFTDAGVYSNSFYRIRSVDLDGKQDFSDVVSVNIPIKRSWFVKQTMVQHTVEVRVPEYNASTWLFLTDLNGKLFVRMKVTQPVSVVPVDAVRKGVYLLTLNHNGRTETKKIFRY